MKTVLGFGQRVYIYGFDCGVDYIFHDFCWYLEGIFGWSADGPAFLAWVWELGFFGASKNRPFLTSYFFTNIFMALGE